MIREVFVCAAVSSTNPSPASDLFDTAPASQATLEEVFVSVDPAAPAPTRSFHTTFSFGRIVTGALADADAPSSSVTVTVAVWLPRLANACVTVAPVAVPPSLKLHAYVSIVPSES